MIKFINCLDQFFLYFAFREFFFLIGYTQILTNPVDWIKSGYETGYFKPVFRDGCKIQSILFVMDMDTKKSKPRTTLHV
jgi:hypothetical protein